jgi:Matrixin
MSTQRLKLERLESREVPAILIQLDYSRDTSGFFNSAEARATMERVASDIGNTLTANLAALTPGGGNTWTATFFDPSTGNTVNLSNLSVGANTLRLFVGARNLPGTTAGYGGYGGYSMSGSQAWMNLVQNRGSSGFAPWGGSITFDTNQNWHFGTTTAGLDPTELDFYSVAAHELGHVLGIGTAPQWTANRSGSTFRGAHSMTTYGGAVPLSSDGAHWADGVTSNGQHTSYDPVLPLGQRVGHTALDAAALRDLGWNSTGAPLSPPASPPAPPPVATVPLANVEPVALGGGDGFVTLYASTVTSQLVSTGIRLQPFAGYRGSVRVATGDFDGDGVQDVATATAAGPDTMLRVTSGRGFDLFGPSVIVGGYRQGLQLAAGDVDGNGSDELLLAAGEGVAPLVFVTTFGGGGLGVMASFVAFDAAGYTGGIRVAAGDLNRDGYDDVVVTSASGGGVVMGYSGAALRQGAPGVLFGASVPFGGPVGLNAAIGDTDGDGYEDLALAFERGGPGVVATWSGRVLTQNLGAPLNALPMQSLFSAMSGNTGTRIAARDVNGDGRDEIIAVSAFPTTPVVSVTTLGQALTGVGGPALFTQTAGGGEGIYAGAEREVFTASSDPRSGMCQCGGCAALAALADRTDPLLADPLAV